MFKKYFEKMSKERFEKMEAELPHLSDSELKSWYANADTQSILGHMCQHERQLFRKIEEELNNRGFEYMRDY